MTNKIIEAARLAGIEFQQHQGITGRVRTTTCGSQAIEKMERFYALAYRQALEDAAKVAEEWKTDWAHCLDVAEAIRKLKEGR